MKRWKSFSGRILQAFGVERRTELGDSRQPLTQKKDRKRIKNRGKDENDVNVEKSSERISSRHILLQRIDGEGKGRIKPFKLRYA